MVCLSISEQDYCECSPVIVRKPCTIMDQRYGKNRLNVEVDATHNGQVAAIFDFHYNALHILWHLHIACPYGPSEIHRPYLGNIEENNRHML